MANEIFVTLEGEELNSAEAIQYLLKKNRALEERMWEVSDMVNLLIGRISFLEQGRSHK
jgi:hypothetical protein